MSNIFLLSSFNLQMTEPMLAASSLDAIPEIETLVNFLYIPSMKSTLKGITIDEAPQL